MDRWIWIDFTVFHMFSSTTGTLFHMLFTPVLWAKKLFLSIPYFISVLMQTLMNPVIPGSHFL